jgi:hypothetical protein
MDVLHLHLNPEMAAMIFSFLYTPPDEAAITTNIIRGKPLSNALCVLGHL